MTSARYVHDRRVERAIEMLSMPDMPMTEIALACGFSHSQHFSNAFRRTTGRSPTDHRSILLHGQITRMVADEAETS